MRKRSPAKAVKSGHNSNAGVRSWTEADKDAVQRQLDHLSKDFRARLPISSPNAQSLLCLPQTEVYARTTEFLTNMNVMGGLILSSLAGAALDPLEVSQFPDGSTARVLANVFNYLAFVCVTVQTILVMYSFFLLVFLSTSTSNPSMVYKFVANATHVFSMMQVITLVPNFGIFIMITVMAQLRCDKVTATAATITVVGLVLGFHAFVCRGMTRINPWSMWGWGIFSPYHFLSKRLRDDALHQGKMMLADAEKGVLLCMDEDGDRAIDVEGERLSCRLGAADPDLIKLVNHAFNAENKNALSPTRKSLLLSALEAQGLRLGLLTDAARTLGSQVLLSMFEFDDIQLTLGERLALATSVMKHAIDDGKLHEQIQEPSADDCKPGNGPDSIVDKQNPAVLEVNLQSLEKKLDL